MRLQAGGAGAGDGPAGPSFPFMPVVSECMGRACSGSGLLAGQHWALTT